MTDEEQDITKVNDDRLFNEIRKKVETTEAEEYLDELEHRFYCYKDSNNVLKILLKE